eukprot:g5783.t1
MPKEKPVSVVVSTKSKKRKKRQVVACNIDGCEKRARGGTGLCFNHGGGRRCGVKGCTRGARGKLGFCVGHGGGRRCAYRDLQTGVPCGRGAQGKNKYCMSHDALCKSLQPCKVSGCPNFSRPYPEQTCEMHADAVSCNYSGCGASVDRLNGLLCTFHYGQMVGLTSYLSTEHLQKVFPTRPPPPVVTTAFSNVNEVRRPNNSAAAAAGVPGQYAMMPIPQTLTYCPLVYPSGIANAVPPLRVSASLELNMEQNVSTLETQRCVVGSDGSRRSSIERPIDGVVISVIGKDKKIEKDFGERQGVEVNDALEKREQANGERKILNNQEHVVLESKNCGSKKKEKGELSRKRNVVVEGVNSSSPVSKNGAGYTIEVSKIEDKDSAADVNQSYQYIPVTSAMLPLYPHQVFPQTHYVSRLSRQPLSANGLPIRTNNVAYGQPLANLNRYPRDSNFGVETSSWTRPQPNSRGFPQVAFAGGDNRAQDRELAKLNDHLFRLTNQLSRHCHELDLNVRNRLCRQIKEVQEKIIRILNSSIS